MREIRKKIEEVVLGPIYYVACGLLVVFATVITLSVTGTALFYKFQYEAAAEQMTQMQKYIHLVETDSVACHEQAQKSRQRLMDPRSWGLGEEPNIKIIPPPNQEEGVKIVPQGERF